MIMLVCSHGCHRNYNEEQDPDYKLPEDDKDWLSDLEELEEVEDNLEEEVKCLVEDAAQPAPERYIFLKRTLTIYVNYL